MPGDQKKRQKETNKKLTRSQAPHAKKIFRDSQSCHAFVVFPAVQS